MFVCIAVVDFFVVEKFAVFGEYFVAVVGDEFLNRVAFGFITRCN